MVRSRQGTKTMEIAQKIQTMEMQKIDKKTIYDKLTDECGVRREVIRRVMHQLHTGKVKI